MSSRISKTFAVLKEKGRTALIPYIMAGDPDMEATRGLILELERSGADIIELGVPFSDPLADGPTIQRAAIRSLANRTNLRSVFALVKDVRRQTQIPIVLMLYYNLIHAHGEERFVKEAVKAGVDGVIVPDLPPEEAITLIGLSRKAGLDTVFLLAPTSDEGRIRAVDAAANGFIYYVSLTGVTGARKALDSKIESSLKTIRRMTGKPVCVGFGISTPEQAAMVAGWADGVIVGSALVSEIEKAPRDGVIDRAGGFVGRLRRGMDDACRVRPMCRTFQNKTR